MSTPKDRERRQHVRHIVCSAAELETGDKSSVGLIRNISVSGALLFTRRKLEAGEPLDITIYINQADTFSTHGSVVRCTPLDAERIGFWGFETGVKFDAELDEHAEALERLNATLES